MKELIRTEIIKHVNESKANYSELIGSLYFDEPIVKFASAIDPISDLYKSIIGNDHLTPCEAFEMAFGTNSFKGGSVTQTIAFF